MNAWLWASLVVLVAGVAPSLALASTGTAMSRLVGLEAASSTTTVALLLLAQGFDRSSYVDVALLLALLSFTGTLVFTRLPGAVAVTPLIVMWLGVAAVVAAALGLLLVRDPADRLHLPSPMNTIGSVLVVLAVAVETGWGRAAVKDLLIALLLVGGGTVAASATAQAMRSGPSSGDPYGDESGEG